MALLLPVTAPVWSAFVKDDAFALAVHVQKYITRFGYGEGTAVFNVAFLLFCLPVFTGLGLGEWQYVTVLYFVRLRLCW